MSSYKHYNLTYQFCIAVPLLLIAAFSYSWQQSGIIKYNLNNGFVWIKQFYVQMNIMQLDFGKYNIPEISYNAINQTNDNLILEKNRTTMIMLITETFVQVRLGQLIFYYKFFLIEYIINYACFFNMTTPIYLIYVLCIVTKLLLKQIKYIFKHIKWCIPVPVSKVVSSES